MEDGDISEMEVSASIKAAESNDLLNKMANYPDVEVTVIKNKNSTDCKTSDSSTKVNGESEKVNSCYSDDEEEFSSDDDALIIDEDIKSVETKPSVNNKRFRSPSPRVNFKGFKKRIIEKSYHSLKIVNELKKFYLFDDKEDLLNHKEDESNKQGELNATITKDSITQCLVNDSDIKTGTKDNCTLTNQKLKKTLTAASTPHIESLKHKQHVTTPSLKSSGKRPIKKRPSQKLTEYAQYLGLQPAVKFKCVKCSESSFPSLSALNEHQRQCLVQPQSNTNTTPTGQSPATTTTTSSSLTTTTIPSASVPASTSTNFRVTRKVFLCSSCGTYYENCNLFLHMREVHRRYICLYCLGMFSLPEKLSHHLVTKHNCSPNHYSSAEDFLSSYSESCFLVCCHCERVFSERDNFYEHVCAEKRIKLTNDPTCWSCGVKDSSVHLPTCRANVDQPPPPSSSTSTHNNQKQTSKSIHPKSQKHKTIKSSQKTAIAPNQHVTADSSSATTSTLSNTIENEDDKTGGHFLADMNFCKNILSENLDANMTETNNEANRQIENTDLNENSTTKKEVTDMEICDNTDANETTNDVTCEITNKDVCNSLEKDNEEDEKATEENELSNNSCSENIVDMKNDENDVKTTSETEKNNSDSECPNPEMDNLENNDKDTSETSATPIPEENVDESQNIDDDVKMEDLDETENCKEESLEKSDNESKESNQNTVVEDTRKVPKVTLKLPPQSLIYSENESDDSEKLTMEVDANYDNDNDSDNDCDESLEHSKSFNECEKPVNGVEDSEKNNSDLNQSDDESFQVAGDEVSIIELELDQPLDKFSIEDLIKTCLSATIPTCIYCNHARKIAVNGKQLGLHAIAEHRFSATVNSITAEELIPKNFVQRIKEGLDEIEFVYFSLVEQEKVQEEIKDDGLHVNTFKHSYECFQCRFVTSIHKELYLHNRKMHAKTILLCIMCKSNFYSYSELICHLCPGNYVLNSETKFHCCMCDSNNLPSAFRLMVHLRKKHHTCDVCLEGCHNQSKLSNHVWKHKLHHLCYRCGIAYRNKPDITKHLFWKHGTESVLCKKCLQKKWPHVYHFCVPPLSFVCEECNLSFSKAVYLKVHKRLHINEKPHACQEENCGETFISKKLLLKHEIRHREPIPIETCVEPVKQDDGNANAENKDEEKIENSDNKESKTEATKEDNIVKEPGSPEKEEIKQKSIIDVYDLPALNLSESDSDSEDEKPKPTIATEPSEEKNDPDEKPENLPNILPATNENVVIPIEEEQKPVPILDGIWDNFKNYQATIEKNSLNTELSNNKEESNDDKIEEECIPDINVILADHDYCLPQTTKDETDDVVMKNDESTGLDHDYCTVSSAKMPSSNQISNSASSENRPKTPDNAEKKKVKTPKKKSSSSSDSSSDSDSSSCTCGSNCSCSSSSGGSSSSSSSSSDSDSSSSEGKRRIAARRERRKERAKRKKESETSHVTNTSAVDVVATEDPVVPIIAPIEIPIEETDLETDETETDEDFYDEYPQRLVNKILAEKRNQLALLASVAPVSNGTILECSRPSTPSMPEEAAAVPKKKVKSKKRKKKSRSSTPKQEEIQQHHNIPDYLNHHRSSPMQVQSVPSVTQQPTVPSPLSIHSIPPTPQTPTVPPLSLTLPPKSQILSQNTPGSGSETETSVRSSKRRRVPNKFYGYSSDEDANEKPVVTPVLKWRKADLPTPPSHVTGSPQLVPPITIKNIPSPAPVVEPVRMAPVIIHHHNEVQESDSETEEVQHRKSATDSSDDNRNNEDSDSDAGQLHISQPQAQLQAHSHSQHRPPGFPPGPHHGHHSMAGFKQGERNENLYCYCQCPYDEVSEMIACDGKDCAIEWFHFECVGIMVPPKGKWFCPDCRKRNTQRSDFIQV